MNKTNPNKKKRVRDKETELKVLLKNKRSCCICHSPDKTIQVHHIDGNPSHNIESNLAVLCLAHHDQATAGLKKGAVGFGIKLTPHEVRTHKIAWETAVVNELTVRKKPVSQRKRAQFEMLFEFEVLKAKAEIITTSSRSNISARLNFLWQFMIEEFITGIPYRKIMLEAFSDIATQSAGQERILLPLVYTIKNLHVHLLPMDKYNVPMTAKDKYALLKSLDILETLAYYSAGLGDRHTGLKETCKGVHSRIVTT